jgi:hypothetical protein
MYFYVNADFGPGHGDVMYYMKKAFVRSTGKALPEGYDDREE